MSINAHVQHGILFKSELYKNIYYYKTQQQRTNLNLLIREWSTVVNNIVWQTILPVSTVFPSLIT